MTYFNTLRLLFQISAFSLGVYAFAYTYINLGFGIWGGFTAYLTIWGHLIHTLYFGSTILEETVIRKNNFFKRITNGLFSISFVISSMVGFLFWSIYFYDRQLIFPEELDKYYPKILNLYQHGFISLIIWIEALFGQRKNLPISSDFLIVYTVSFSYLFWSFIVAQVDRWPYPFQKDFHLTNHLIFDATAIFCGTLVLYFKRFVVDTLYKRGNKTSKQKKK